MMALRTPWVVAVAGLLTTSLAWAHDYWLLPDLVRAPRGASVALSLWVGDDFVPEEARGWQRARTTRFVVMGPSGETDLLASPTEGANPLVRYTPPAVGGHLFVMERNAAHLELPAARFEAYLREEGHTAAVAERARRGETERPGRERYFRSLKAFVQVGDGGDRVSTRVVGGGLELVPQGALGAARVGGRLVIEARYRGAPRAGVRVEALSRVGDDVRMMRAQTGADGRVWFAIDRAATWLVRSVVMERCEGCTDAEWESHWSALVFGVCAPGVARCESATMRVAEADSGASLEGR